MSFGSGKELKKVIKNKPRLQNILIANLAISTLLIVLCSVGNLKEKTTQKLFLSISGIMISGSLFGYARRFDDTEDAAEYQINLAKEDFKGELDTDMAVNNAVRREGIKSKVFLELEKEFGENPIARMLHEQRNRALDQQDDDENDQPAEEKTAFDELTEQAQTSELITDEQFQKIKKLSTEIGLIKATTQVTGYTRESPEWIQIKTELQRRLGQ